MQKKKSGVKKCLEICVIKRGVGGVGRLMANIILNFHFDYWNPSLMLITYLSRQYDYYEISTEPALSTFSKFLGLLSTLLLNSTCFAGKKCNIKAISRHFMTLTSGLLIGEGLSHRCRSRWRPLVLGRPTEDSG